MVDSVTNISSTAANAANSLTGGGTSSVDFNTFLKLLTTQLQNQDPLNPAEGTEFTAQIAQFSQLEQQVGTNEYLKQLAAQTNFNQQALAVSYMGKDVLVSGGLVNTETAGEKVEFVYSLENPSAAGVIIEVTDESGAIVRSLEGDGASGSHPVSWDGKDDGGEDLPAGNYRFTLSVPAAAGDVTGKKELLTYGEVTEVESAAGFTVLKLADGRVVNFEDVLTVRQGNNG